MPELNRVDFYGRKPTTLPRFVYRRLAKALADPSADRTALIDAAIAECQGAQPDLRKFKFVIPDYLLPQLSAEERARLEAGLDARRGRAAQLKLVFPHVSDEFSLRPEFLASVLDLDHGPQIPQGGRFFTIGSCFARNIAEFLRHNGVDADTFPMAEDLNSPISNAFLFDLLQKPPEARVAIVSDWVAKIFPELPPDDVADQTARRCGAIDLLAAELARADAVVLTLGNVVDFFRDGADSQVPLMAKTVPKFVAMPGDEDLNVRANAASRLKKAGASLRLASYAETCEAIAACIAGIRSVTQVPLIVTLSPVPVDSVIGLSGARSGSAVEVDCVSKSRLRSAFDETAAGPLGENLSYFPSFEIVRWIAPVLPMPNFGMDDAASRHVSAPVLDAICALFLTRFLRWTVPAADRETGALSA